MPQCLRVFVPFILLMFACGATLNGDQLPNIIYLLADDLGYAELGCYGQKWIKTPNIDRIAREGIRFTQHYSGNAVCAPARCNLMTGKHPGHAYIRTNGNPKDLQVLKEKNGWEFPGQNPIPDAEVTIVEPYKLKFSRFVDAPRLRKRLLAPAERAGMRWTLVYYDNWRESNDRAMFALVLSKRNERDARGRRPRP